MRYLFLFFVFIMSFTSCVTNYEKEDLYGSWANDDWAFTFNKDNSCKILTNGIEVPGNNTFRTFGNTLEFVRSGKIFLSNVTVKSIEKDILTLEMRPMFSGNDVTTQLVVLKKK